MTDEPGATGSRTLGVVGTLVWDTIVAAGDQPTVQEWGGIAYSLATLDVALAPDWAALPIVKVGRDLERPARSFLDAQDRVDPSALVVVAESNNRVELRYHDAHERTETLTGGVPAWTASELLPIAARCDALYLNFISGFEMSLDTAAELRRSFSGPIYIDLHSLFLGINNLGQRVPRCLDNAGRWFELGNVIQLNRAEANLLVDDGSSPSADGPAGVAITEGPEGVRYEVVPPLLRTTPQWPTQVRAADRSVRGRVAPDEGAAVVDPTGCGDVWGAAFFAGLLGGLGARQAAERGTRMAEAALAVRGASQVRAALASLGVTSQRAP